MYKRFNWNRVRILRANNLQPHYPSFSLTGGRKIFGKQGRGYPLGGHQDKFQDLYVPTPSPVSCPYMLPVLAALTTAGLTQLQAQEELALGNVYILPILWRNYSSSKVTEFFAGEPQSMLTLPASDKGTCTTPVTKILEKTCTSRGFFKENGHFLVAQSLVQCLTYLDIQDFMYCLSNE